MCVFVGFDTCSFTLSQVRLSSGWRAAANRSKPSGARIFRVRRHNIALQLEVTTVTTDAPSPPSLRLFYALTRLSSPAQG